MIRLPGYCLRYAAGNREITRRSPQVGDYTRETDLASTRRRDGADLASGLRAERIALVVFVLIFVIPIGPAVVVVRIDVAAAGPATATIIVFVFVIHGRDGLWRVRAER